MSKNISHMLLEIMIVFERGNSTLHWNLEVPDITDLSEQTTRHWGLNPGSHSE